MVIRWIEFILKWANSQNWPRWLCFSDFWKRVTATELPSSDFEVRPWTKRYMMPVEYDKSSGKTQLELSSISVTAIHSHVCQNAYQACGACLHSFLSPSTVWFFGDVKYSYKNIVGVGVVCAKFPWTSNHPKSSAYYNRKWDYLQGSVSKVM